LSPNEWKSWGASVTGPLHARRGLPNQDAWISRHYCWGDVIAISDGLGSHRHSEVGARAACRSVIETAKAFHRNPDARIEDLLRLVHANWLLRIAPLEPQECSATCLFAIHVGSKCFIAQLGDGLIAVCAEIKEETILITDNKLDSFSNVTDSLSNEFRLDQWQYRVISAESCQAIVLCSDGISDDIFPEMQADFANELYRSYQKSSHQEQSEHLISWMTNWPVPGHTDDKTVVCLFKKQRSLL